MFRRVVVGASVAVVSGAYYEKELKERVVSQCSWWGGGDPANSAFVFIKPHANTTATQAAVKQALLDKKLAIKAEGEIKGEIIDEQLLIDQHYYAIASKATILKPKDLPVPDAKFKERFGLSYADALAGGNVYNAIDACKMLGVDAAGLDAIWSKSKPLKLGGGFYVSKVEPGIPGKPKEIYVFNAFFMSMRSQFVKPGTSIHYYVVDWDPKDLSWADFRGKVLGPTDPAKAPEGSVRGLIMNDWQKLGLDFKPNTGSNGVHASASPFEGLAEKMNWLKVKPSNDAFGAALNKAGVDNATISAWSVDPQVKGASLFDQLEDLDAVECVTKAVELAKK
jgi:hypothetical protein